MFSVGYVDFVRLEGEDGVLDLRGVPNGAHTVLIGAGGYIGQVRRVVVRDGAHRSIEATLRPRR